jgi:hypothetical protein
MKVIHSLLLLPPQHCWHCARWRKTNWTCWQLRPGKKLNCSFGTYCFRHHIVNSVFTTPAKSRHTTGLTAIRWLMLESDRSHFLNGGVSCATFHAAGTWPEHRTARKKTAEQGCQNMLQRVVSTARNSMLNERRSNAVIASGKCGVCAG